MEKKIESGVLAKIFGLYIGCEVENNIGKHMGRCVGIGIDGMATINPLDKFDPRICSISVLRLILTPLSEITDEDKIGLGSIIQRDVPERIYTDHLKQCGIDFVAAIIQNDDAMDFDFRLLLWIEAFDYLRSRGYALPYMGIDLFDAGIAIPKTNK